MLDALPLQVRGVLLRYGFIKKYLEGKMPKKVYLDNLKSYHDELISKGVSPEYIDLISNADDDNNYNRKASNSRFVRFARKLGLDVATKDDKIRFIKSISAEKFLDILSVSAGLLRGAFSFQRFRDKKEDRSIISMNGATDLDPPDHPEIEFKKFFHLMQNNISVSTMHIWAVKLYFAIVFSHMFTNGNGRLARNAYFLLKSDGLLDEKQSSNRSAAVQDACQRANNLATLKLLEKEGINTEDRDKALIHYADENTEEGEMIVGEGNAACLKFIAAKKVLEKYHKYNGQEQIGMKNWTTEMKQSFNAEYQKARIEMFWKVIEISEIHHEAISSLLDETVKK